MAERVLLSITNKRFENNQQNITANCNSIINVGVGLKTTLVNLKRWFILSTGT